jgi:hypothetical protein
MYGQPTIRGTRLTVRRAPAALAIYPERAELLREYRTGWSGAYLFLGYYAVPYLGFYVMQHPGFCAAACSLARLLSKQPQGSAM